VCASDRLGRTAGWQTMGQTFPPLKQKH